MTTLHELDGRKQVLLSDIRGKESRLGQIKPRIASLKDVKLLPICIMLITIFSGSETSAGHPGTEVGYWIASGSGKAYHVSR